MKESSNMVNSKDSEGLLIAMENARSVTGQSLTALVFHIILGLGMFPSEVS
jgi:hypothetical protein